MTAAGSRAFRWRDDGEAAPGRRRVEIPAESPLFDGHFPGHAILPGIAHLAIVERALGPFCAVRSVKLRRPVLPGEVLDLSTAPPAEDAWVRFELRRDGEVVSTGAVLLGPPADLQPAPDHWETKAGASFPAVEDLLPHAPPARLVRGIAAASPEGIVCLVEVPPDHPLVAGGSVPAFVGIEMAAQAAAVLEALSRRQEALQPRIGYLVGVREARFTVSSLPAGRLLRATARFQGGAFPLSRYEIGVGEPDRERVTGAISTYIAGQTPTRGG
jgi:predicted hotdog family 3-hydroxylacyl-ACP dehydratase